jgi:hypothetical protein
MKKGAFAPFFICCESVSHNKNLQGVYPFTDTPLLKVCNSKGPSDSSPMWK